MAGELRFAGNRIAGSALWRRETWEEREYLIAPVVGIRAGVLNKELVPAEEIASGFGSWNGRPVTLDHPMVEGAFVSANHPLLLSQYQVGNVFNARFDDGALKAEMWIDVARAQGSEAGLELLRRVEGEEPVEVSTAYFRAIEQLNGELAGMAFEAIARDLKPDHLAVLLNAKGACSWERGCGVPRVNEGGEVGMRVNILSEARKPAYEGTEEISWEDVSKTFEAYRDGYYQHGGGEKPEEVPVAVGDAPAAMRRWIASKTLLGDAEADNARDLIFFPVVNPGTDKLNAGAVRAVLGGRAAQADIPEAALASAQAAARKMLEDEFGGEPAVNAGGGAVARAWQTISRALGNLLAAQQDVEVAPGGPEMCVCPECGYEQAKERGVPCRSVECPECGAMLVAGDQADEEEEEAEESPAGNEGEVDLEEQVRRVRGAFYEHMSQPPAEDVQGQYWVRAVFAERVIVEDGDGLLSYEYQVTEDGVAFQGPVRVEIVYQPVESAAGEGAGSEPQANSEPGADEPPQVTMMEVEDVDMKLLAQVAAKFGLAVEEEDADGVLQGLLEYEAPAQPEQPCAEYEALIAHAREHGGPEATLSVLRASEEAQETQRKALVERIAANEANALTEEELEALELSVLERLAGMLEPGNYSGTPVQETVAGEQVYDLPPMGI